MVLYKRLWTEWRKNTEKQKQEQEPSSNFMTWPRGLIQSASIRKKSKVFPQFLFYDCFLSRLSLQFNLTKRTQFRDVLQEMHNKKKLRKVKRAASEDRPQAGVKLITLKSGFHHLTNTWLRKQETFVLRQSPLKMEFTTLQASHEDLNCSHDDVYQNV